MCARLIKIHRSVTYTLQSDILGELSAGKYCSMSPAVNVPSDVQPRPTFGQVALALSDTDQTTYEWVCSDYPDSGNLSAG